jgi:hypothetical protein
MMGISGEALPAVQTNSRLGATELEQLRKKINNKDYIYEAVQRMALILSNELLDISRGGVFHEQWKRRK